MFPEEGDLRLAGRVDINGFATGALQVFIDGGFGGVCINNFGARDADVACRQMGFVGGAYLDNAVDPDQVAASTEVCLVLQHFSSMCSRSDGLPRTYSFDGHPNPSPPYHPMQTHHQVPHGCTCMCAG